MTHQITQLDEQMGLKLDRMLSLLHDLLTGAEREALRQLPEALVLHKRRQLYRIEQLDWEERLVQALSACDIRGELTLYQAAERSKEGLNALRLKALRALQHAMSLSAACTPEDHFDESTVDLTQPAAGVLLSDQRDALFSLRSLLRQLDRVSELSQPLQRLVSALHSAPDETEA